jgi:hypothetical protein
MKTDVEGDAELILLDEAAARQTSLHRNEGHACLDRLSNKISVKNIEYARVDEHEAIELVLKQAEVLSYAWTV